MIILFKHIFLLLGYASLCFTIVWWNMNTDFAVYIGMVSTYSLLRMVPKINQIYVYNIVERTIPKTSYILRVVFHYCLYKDSRTSAFSSVVAILSISILKDLIFLVGHAERRIAKIEQLLYEDGCKKRIVHLHSNIYTDDQLTRFHQHCFDTNRLYLDTVSASAENAALAINNYRNIRKNRNKPREFTSEEDKLFYTASSNAFVFVSNRYAFYIVPLFLILWCTAMVNISMNYRLVYNTLLIGADLCTMPFGKKVNDVTIDMAYFMATVMTLVYPF